MPVMENEREVALPSEDEIRKMAEKMQQNQEEDIAFSENMDKFLVSKKTSDFLTLGKTSNALALAGANSDLNIVIAPNTIAKCMSEPDEHYHGHGLSADIMKRIPAELRNPAMIFKGAHDNTLVAITALKDKENREIMVAISLAEKQGFREVNRVASIYGRNNMQNYLQAQMEQGNLIAANIEKANEMLHSAGLQLPLENTFISFNDSIAYTTANVKHPEQNLTENTHFHDAIEHDKLIPILNVKAAYHEERLNTLKEKRDTRVAKVAKNEAKIEKLNDKIERLENRNKMLQLLKVPGAAALVERNNEKIQEIQKEKIPAREHKIENHKQRIAEIDKKSAVIAHKLERSVAWNDTVKSYLIPGKAHREKFADAMNRLHISQRNCLVDKTEMAKIKIEKAQELYDRANAGDKVARLKNLEKCKAQLEDMKDKISTLGNEIALYSNRDDKTIDTIMVNTAKVIDKHMAQEDFSIAKMSEEVCVSNAELIKQLSMMNERLANLEQGKTASQKEDNPFEYLKNTEMAMEDDYNSIDGIINNGKRDEPIEAVSQEVAQEEEKEVQNEAPATASKADESIEAKEDEKQSDILSQLKAAGVATVKRNGAFKVNGDYYNALPRNERHTESMTREESLKVMEALTAAKVVFSAATQKENKVGITVANKDEAALNDVMYASIGKIAKTKALQENRETYKEKPRILAGDKVNADYYASLSEKQRSTYYCSEENGEKMMQALKERNIPFSAVYYTHSMAVTVSKTNENAFQKIHDEVLGKTAEKCINPDFYKSLSKEERFTQRMTESQAKEKIQELKNEGVEHSAVLNGNQSRVTVAKKDGKAFFSRDRLKRDARRISNKAKQEPQKQHNKDEKGQER